MSEIYLVAVGKHSWSSTHGRSIVNRLYRCVNSYFDYIFFSSRLSSSTQYYHQATVTALLTRSSIYVCKGMTFLLFVSLLKKLLKSSNCFSLLTKLG